MCIRDRLCSSGVYYMDTIADSLQGGTVILNGGGAVSFDPQHIAPDEELTIVVDGAQGRFRTTDVYKRQEYGPDKGKRIRFAEVAFR